MSSREPKRVLVTGATGFIGRSTVRALIRRGFSVRRALRAPSVAEMAGDVVIGDLAAPADLGHALQNVDTVVHLAGQVRAKGRDAAANEAALMAVNAAGTWQLARAAAREGVRSFVFLSTVKVNGEATVLGRPFTEADQPNPQDAYARSKLAGERALGEVSGLQTTILRSPLVYGPGVGANFLRLLEAVYRGVPLPLGLVQNRRSMIYLQNLADLISQAVARKVSGTYLVADSPPVCVPQLAEEIGQALGRPARLISAPVSLLRLAGFLTGRANAVGRLIGSLEVDVTQSHQVFEPGPVRSRGQAVDHTCKWFREMRR